MGALGLSLGILLVWLAQGLGFVQRFAPELRRQTLVGWIAAIWLGLVLDVVILANLYFLIPGCTIERVAWPVTLVLVATSIGLYVRSARPKPTLDAASWAVIVLAALATLLVLRPLLAHVDLGFYFSNNGEFSTYAGLADAVQYHDSATNVGGPVAMVSREAVVGALGAAIAVLSGKAAIWVIQPLAAAFAALAFASFGLLLRHVAIVFKLGKIARIALLLLGVWATMSAAQQCFWTLSFASQYLSIAVFFGGLVVLVEGHELARSRSVIVLGVMLGALVYAYPEMAVPNVGLLGAFVIVAAPRSSRARMQAAVNVLAGVAIAAVLTNRFSYGMFSNGVNVGGSGWDIYGPHRPALGFVASVTGFTSTFAGPATCHALWPAVTVALAGLGAGVALVGLGREPAGGVRGLRAGGVLFLIGIPFLFWTLARHDIHTNYAVLKFILGYGWLAYLTIAIAIAALARSLPRATIALAVLVVICAGLWSPAMRFTRSLRRASHDALFLESEGRALRAQLPPDTRAYVASGWFNYGIIGEFLANDRDLVHVNGHWLDGSNIHLEPGQPILLLGDHKLSDEPQVHEPYRVTWRGQNFVLMQPDR